MDLDQVGAETLDPARQDLEIAPGLEVSVAEGPEAEDVHRAHR